nr:substrate-binding domain-containing protein [Aliamphritea spongicola]
MKVLLRSVFLGCSLLLAANAGAAEVRIAVASNFIAAMEALAERFTADSGHSTKLIFGSTGKHYAQIKHGAPFDVFLRRIPSGRNCSRKKVLRCLAAVLPMLPASWCCGARMPA